MLVSDESSSSSEAPILTTDLFLSPASASEMATRWCHRSKQRSTSRFGMRQQDRTKTCKFISLDDVVLHKPSFRANEDLLLLSFAYRNEQTPPASATITPFVCNIKTTLTLIAAQEEDKTPQSRCETEQEESFEIKSQVSDLTDDTDREEVTSAANLKATKNKTR